MSRILVTGAAGFIGFCLAQKLLQLGHDVYGIDNLNDYYDVSLKQSRLDILTPHKNFRFDKIALEDKTDLDKAFDYLIAKGHKAVNVVWATGKRADHTITNITNIVAYRDQLKIVVLDDHSKVFLLQKKYEKWYPKNTTISLIPIGKVTGITTKNLFYPLKNEELIIGYRTGSSNHVSEDGIVTIEHQEGDLLLMECWD